MFKKIFLILFFVTTAAFSAQAQVILKNGKNVEGVIVTKTDDYVQIDTGVGVVVTYYLDEIQSIQGVPTQSAPAPALAVPVPVGENQIDQFKQMFPEGENVQSQESVPPAGYFVDKQDAEKRVDYQAKVIKSSVDNLNKDFKKEIEVIQLDLREKISEQTQKVNEQVDVILGVFQIFPPNVILPFLVGWIFCGIPMFFIARKLNMPHAWIAFIPFLNFFMLILMADKGLWWCLHFIYPIAVMILPYYIPVENPHLYFFAGYFFLLVNIFLIPVFLWKYIFYLVRIPAWLSLLTTLPGINVGMLAVAALPEKKQRMLKYAIFGKPKFGQPRVPIQKNSIGRF